MAPIQGGGEWLKVTKMHQTQLMETKLDQDPLTELGAREGLEALLELALLAVTFRRDGPSPVNRMATHVGCPGPSVP